MKKNIIFLFIPLFLIQFSVSFETDQQALLAFQNLVTSPSHFWSVIGLKILLFAHNITGDIPRNIGCLSKLEEFYIGDNPIEGTIPASLGNISTLLNLFCSSNRIVGQIPPKLGKLSSLRQLNFRDNSNLSGQIPEAIFNISSLKLISLNFNNLSGRIPATTGLHLPNLQGLHLGHNQIEGEIPLFITNASKLEILELAHNFLTGAIPTNLENFVSCNIFSYILINLPMNQESMMGFNPLNGVLPNSIGNLSYTIEKIHLADAHISGLIPTNIGNMSGLTALIFQQNNLTGSIPSDIPACAITNPEKQSKLKEVVLKIVTPVKKGKSKDVEQITFKSEICITCMIELALDCTKEMPESRITMKDVVKRLNKIKNTFLET
ncbi:hypothetical protein H5410_047134 [Solanum commersonii]|uniref:Uncharacterized protein n=1 Tax=Solanum commersonii TaxID=4109 RepID=A0A9J5XHF3_SOLCO|nr:hypothetical protein H5410_047134 [Solanum commersonii]